MWYKLFTLTLERQKVQDKIDVNDDDTEMCTEKEDESEEKMCTSPDIELEVTPRPIREAAQKANDSIHSILAKKPQLPTLTMPKTPDVLK